MDNNSNSKNIPIPNALTITINTSVPGYQIIKYKPNMSVKNIDKDDKTIWFDPLVPLDQSVINKVPESVRVLQFFNKGLFDSLINYHGNKKQITLEQAKKKQIIDNNIQVTLNTLFPTNGILYIKGEPYAVADVQWSKGTWKIDRKIKEVPKIDVNKISDPITYNNIIKNDIQLGNKQLEQLPKALIYGANFNKENEVPSSIDKDKELLDKKAQEADAKSKTLEDSKIKLAADAKSKALEEARIKAVEESRLRASQIKKPPILAIEDGLKPVKPVLEIEDGLKPVKPPKPILAIEDGLKPPKPPKPPKPIFKIEDIKNIQMSPNFLPNLEVSQDSTKILRSYFGNDTFYSMVSMIFRYMTEEQKVFIQNIFKNTTNIDVKELSANISKAAYNFTITGAKTVSSDGVSIKKNFTNGLRVISNSGGGNCLFLAVADAINYYNYNNDIGEKIIYNRYGNGDNLFTIAVLRNIVSTEIIKKFNSDEDFRNESLDIGRINLDILNDTFERVIMTPESISLNSSEYYDSTILDVYRGNDNEIKQYIESVYYWADQKTIDIFNKILQLNIITIQKQGDKFILPYPTIKMDDNNNTWNKYLFLYNTENHYELITIDYLIKKSGKPAQIKKTIFNRNSNIIPPFYIIFFIFSVFFVKLSSEDKKMIVLFSDFLYAIQNSFKDIISRPISSDINISNFITNFENYFGPIREILGGAITNTNNTFSKKNVKKEDKEDSVQISFYITIDMELQKGTTLSKEEISNIKCVKGWNKVRKSYADFTGKKYVIPPVYENLSDKYDKKEDKNGANNTKKNTNGGKRRRKTLKNYATK